MLLISFMLKFCKLFFSPFRSSLSHSFLILGRNCDVINTLFCSCPHYLFISFHKVYIFFCSVLFQFLFDLIIYLLTSYYVIVFQCITNFKRLLYKINHKTLKYYYNFLCYYQEIVPFSCFRQHFILKRPLLESSKQSSFKKHVYAEPYYIFRNSVSKDILFFSFLFY